MLVSLSDESFGLRLYNLFLGWCGVLAIIGQNNMAIIVNSCNLSVAILHLSNIQMQKTGVGVLFHDQEDLSASDLGRSKDRKNKTKAMRRFARNSCM